MTIHPARPTQPFTDPADWRRELDAARREVPDDIDATDLAVAVRQLAQQRDNLHTNLIAARATR